MDSRKGIRQIDQQRFDADEQNRRLITPGPEPQVFPPQLQPEGQHFLPTQEVNTVSVRTVPCKQTPQLQARIVKRAAIAMLRTHDPDDAPMSFHRVHGRRI